MMIAQKSWFLTESGALTNDQNEAVIQLVLEGSPIPSEVLRDYPEIGADPVVDEPLTIQLGGGVEPSSDGLESLTVAQLKSRAEALGIDPIPKSKAELIEALRADADDTQDAKDD